MSYVSFHIFKMSKLCKLVTVLLVGSFGLEVESAKPDLYYLNLSPPSRTVLMALKLLGTDVNLKVLDVSKGHQFTPEFLKLNPQHTVPTLDDNGFTLSESRAIISYLAGKSPQGDKLYPKDPQQRAVVDQMMYFDLDKLYGRMLRFFVHEADATPMVYGAPYNSYRAELLDAAFAMLEEYLTRHSWAAGDNMTLADITLLTTVSMAEGCGYDVGKYPKVKNWLEKMKPLIPDYKAINEDPIEMWKNASLSMKTK